MRYACIDRCLGFRGGGDEDDGLGWIGWEEVIWCLDGGVCMYVRKGVCCRYWFSRDGFCKR